MNDFVNYFFRILLVVVSIFCVEFQIRAFFRIISRAHLMEFALFCVCLFIFQPIYRFLLDFISFYRKFIVLVFVDLSFAQRRELLIFAENFRELELIYLSTHTLTSYNKQLTRLKLAAELVNYSEYVLNFT